MAEAQTNEAPLPDEAAIPADMGMEEAASLLDSFGDAPEAEAEAAAPQNSEEPDASVKKLPLSPLSEEGQAEANEESPAPEPEEASDDDDATPVLKEPSSSDNEEELAADSEDENLSPIDPPKSLNKKERELFRSLPHEVQNSWSELEDGRNREVRHHSSTQMPLGIGLQTKPL